jgi:hypothetical protein
MIESVFFAPPLPAADCGSGVPGISMMLPKASQLLAPPVSSTRRLAASTGGKLKVT